MSDELFTEFEERPPGCSACYVTVENIDRLAAYFHTGYDEATVIRRGVVTDQPNIELRLIYKGKTVSVLPGQVLLYGHPPTVVDEDVFRRKWRQAR